MDNKLFIESHANYLRKPLQPKELKVLVNRIVRLIEEKFPDVDYIAGMGMSGLAILSAVSYVSGKKMFILRKHTDDDNHSTIGMSMSNHRYNEYYPSEGKNCTAIVIDDLISSGDTMVKIYHRLSSLNILMEGIILYCQEKDDGDEFVVDNLGIPVHSVSYFNEIFDSEEYDDGEYKLGGR